jgi:hypothetical protein
VAIPDIAPWEVAECRGPSMLRTTSCPLRIGVSIHVAGIAAPLLISPTDSAIIGTAFLFPRLSTGCHKHTMYSAYSTVQVGAWGCFLHMATRRRRGHASDGVVMPCHSQRNLFCFCQPVTQVNVGLLRVRELASIAQFYSRRSLCTFGAERYPYPR